MTNTERALPSLRVLITRPAGRAESLCTAIAAHGGTATHIPLLAVLPLDAGQDVAICSATAACLRALDRYQRVIAISVNAVHFGMPWIKNYWPCLPQHIAWYGIGAATNAALAEHGIATSAVAASTAMTSEALLAASELQHLSGERILILRGVGGREQLAAVLRARGARVDYAECYRRSEPVLNAQQRALLDAMAFDAICVNSNETLQNLWQCLSPAARALAAACALIAPSERVAENARNLGFARVITAANAGTEATVAALRQIAAERP